MAKNIQKNNRPILGKVKRQLLVLGIVLKQQKNQQILGFELLQRNVQQILGFVPLQQPNGQKILGFIQIQNKQPLLLLCRHRSVINGTVSEPHSFEIFILVLIYCLKE